MDRRPGGVPAGSSDPAPGRPVRSIFAIKALGNPGGGAERVLVDVVNGLAARGDDVGVVSFDAPGVRSHYALDSEIPWFQLGIGKTDSRATLHGTIRRMVAMRRTVRELQPEVVVGFMHSMFVPLAVALSGSGIPVIASEHIVLEHYRQRHLERMLLNVVPPLVKRITCVSSDVRGMYPWWLARKMIVIPNPVTVPKEQKSRAYEERPKVVLAVGRLEDQKDFGTLVSAFGSVCDDFPEWRLRIVGDGSLRGSLESQIQASGLGDRVLLPGFAQDIATEYESAQIFVMPSLYESFGLVLAEALAYGLPVIGFDDCPGVNSLIEPGVNGLLAAPGNDRPAGLAVTLRLMLEDDDRRRQFANRNEESSTAFGLDRVLEEWTALLEETSSRRRRSG